MSVRRAVSAVAIAALLGGCVVGSGAAYSGEDKADRPSWKHKRDGSGGAAKADRIALDALGDADRGVDVQSLAVFNPADLDFVGLSITGRDFGTSAARAVGVYLDTNRKWAGPEYRLVAFNTSRGADAASVRLYRVGDWGDADPKRVNCTSLRVQFDIAQVSQIRIAAPRKCLGGVRGALRANATVWRQQKPSWQTDPGPSKDADVVPDSRVLTQPAS